MGLPSMSEFKLLPWLTVHTLRIDEKFPPFCKNSAPGEKQQAQQFTLQKVK
jgi:hypothetical protein